MARSRLLVITGTGTGIGKTHLSEALLHALGARGRRTVGLKAVETGVIPGARSDVTRLAAASTFHVQHAGYTFAAPLSPHLAARDAGARPIHLPTLVHFIASARENADVALVELPGGLFSPLTDTLVNADLVRVLQPDVTVLVAADRLGVLHDVLAAARAAVGVPVRLDAVALVAPPAGDTSTGRNAPELRRLTRIPCVVAIARKEVADLLGDPAVARLAALVDP
jgi:dethiobiotin synthetase